MSSYPISKSRCPECAKLGKDTSHDNLITYSDGHSYCFGCGHRTGGSGLSRIVNRQEEVVNNQVLSLPLDSSYEYPKVALDWVGQYELDRNDLIRHRVIWSDYFERLIFPVFDETGLLGYQGRYLGNKEGKAKWWGQGRLEEILHILKSEDDSCIILVEDIVSAIKLQKVGHTSMPIFGSHLSLSRLNRIGRYYKDVVIWLDPDKRKESILFQTRAKTVGLKARVIFSDKDPKEHTNVDIKRILQN